MKGKGIASAWVGLNTLGQSRLSEGAQPYLLFFADEARRASPRGDLLAW
jgi:hypothetical protein